MAWTTPKTWAVGDPGTSSDLNTYVRDNAKFLYGDVAYIAPALTNGWVNFGGTDSVAGYRKIGTRVFLKGVIKSGTLAAAAFTLPAGYRPAADSFLAAVSNAALGFLSITAVAGTCNPSGSNVYFSMDGMSFDTIT